MGAKLREVIPNCVDLEKMTPGQIGVVVNGPNEGDIIKRLCNSSGVFAAIISTSSGEYYSSPLSGVEVRILRPGELIEIT